MCYNSRMVYVHLADGFEEIEALTVIDLLRRANIEVESVSVAGRLPVRGAHGIEIVADTLFEDAVYGDADALVLPGGLPGATNLYEHEGLREKIFAAAHQGKWLCAICAAPLVLGRNGLLEGRNATCYPGFESELKGAKTVQDPAVPVVIDENAESGNAKIITSRGPGTAIPFALAIIKALAGEATRASIAKGLLGQD